MELLAALFTGGVGKFSNQEFMVRSGTEQIGEFEVFIAQAVKAEVGNALAQLA